MLKANSNMEKQQPTTTSSSGDKDSLWNEVTNPIRKPKINNTATVANASSSSNSGSGSINANSNGSVI
jgi:hypothetical protein